MRHINHKSDFQVIINIKDKEGNIIAPPSVPWEAVFSDENGCEFKCYFDGTNYTHCIVDFSDIVCFIDNPGFSCGKLRCTFHQHVPSEEYCDGVMDLSQPLQCDIMLSKRESDDATPITIEASPNWVRGEQGIQGIQGEKGADGFSPIVSLTKDGSISTLSITDSQGEHTTEIADGAKGDDGFSPVVSLNKVDKVTTLTITDANGEHTAEINDGGMAEIVQEQGNSTDKVMSQDAVTKALKMSTANASGSVTLQPNTYYTCVGNCDFTLGAMGTTDEVVIKTSGAYSHTFTDVDLKWHNVPSFESGKTYLISIQNKLGLWVAFAD